MWAPDGHGLLMQGTFITEWEAGAAICKEMLGSQPLYTALAEQMVW